MCEGTRVKIDVFNGLYYCSFLIEGTLPVSEYYSRNNQIYFESVSNYPHDHRGVKWATSASQFLRFKILTEINQNTLISNLLDVGCGLGHLVDFLNTQQFRGQYKGIDIVYQMTVNAKKRHPNADFENTDIDSLPIASYDYVLASGIFAFTSIEIIKSLLPPLFDRATQGLAFNCLSLHATEKEEGMHYHDPNDVFDFCQTLTPNVKLRHDYLPHDFTMYLYR